MNASIHNSFITRFLTGEAVSAFWGLLTKGVGLINTLLTISSLTLYQYGVFQLLLSVAGLSSDFLNLGGGVVPTEMSRAIADKREGDAKGIFLEYSFFRIAVAVILWAVVFFGAPIIFSSYSLDFIHDTRVISFLFITEAAFIIMKTLFLVRLEFGIVGIRSTINKIVQVVILLYFFIQGNLGLVPLIWSVTIASAVSVIAVLGRFFVVYSRWDRVARPSQLLLPHIFFVYGKWDIIRQISNRIAFRLRPWLIKFFINTEAVAIFSIADMIISTLQDVLPSKTLQSLIPLWMKDARQSNAIFSYGVKYFALCGFFVGLVGLLIVPPVTSMFFSKYSASIPLFYVMIINLPIFAAGIVTANYIIAFRRQKFLFVQHTARNVFSLVFILVTLPFIGLWGLAIESVLVPFLMTVSAYLYTRHRDPGFFFDRHIIFGFSQEDKNIIRKSLAIMRSWFQRKRLSV